MTLLNTKTKDFFNIGDTWVSYRDALRIYSRQEHSERLSIIEIEGEHGYCPELLDASISWSTSPSLLMLMRPAAPVASLYSAIILPVPKS